MAHALSVNQVKEVVAGTAAVFRGVSQVLTVEHLVSLSVNGQCL